VRGRVPASWAPWLQPWRASIPSAARGPGLRTLPSAVCPVRFERTLSAYSAPRLLPLVYEHMEPPPGADPGLLPYGGRAAAVRGGVASGAGLEPAGAGVRALLGTPSPHPESKALGSAAVVNRLGYLHLGARARGGSRTRIRQFLRLAALPVGCTRAWCAARGSNSAPQIKSLMHHHNACSA
jgi:hypothetical protein